MMDEPSCPEGCSSLGMRSLAAAEKVLRGLGTHVNDEDRRLRFLWTIVS